ncbi:ABC transporter permease [Arthrobacter monumenti]
MLQVALSQLRMHARRFIAVGLAVMLAVGFLTATLTVNATTKASLQASLGESYAGADLVITAPPEGGGMLTGNTLETAGGLDPVEAAYGQMRTFVPFTAGGETGHASLTNTAPTAELEAAQLLKGKLPTRAGQVSVDEDTAEQYDLAPGDEILLNSMAPVPSAPKSSGDDGGTAGSGDDGGTRPGETLTVSGIVAASNNPMTASQPQLLATSEQVQQISSGTPSYTAIQLSLAPGTDAAAAAESIGSQLDGSGNGETVAVLTAEQQILTDVAALTGGTDQLTVVLLAFAVIAVLVSGLVIANTFSVLLAQRTRELALLRCVGAGRAQIRLSVLTEAFLVALAASGLGVLLAVGVMFGLVSWARTIPGSGFATLAVPPSAVIAGIVVGVLMTLIAALAPAKAATAVAPLAALRPAEDVSVGNKRGKVRLGIGMFLLVAGAVMLVGGAVTSSLLVAVPGGAFTFIGFLLCATLFVPKVVAAFGRLAAPLGVPGKLAAVNAVRNPARTSSTAAALLIGVTLVTMMMTGAETARHTFDAELDARYPVEMTVSGPSGTGTPLDAETAAAARAVEGVTAAVFLPVAGTLKIDDDGEAGGEPGDSAGSETGSEASREAGGETGSNGANDVGITEGGAIGGPESNGIFGRAVLALEPSAADDVLRDDAIEINDSTIIMPAGTTEKTLTVVGASGEVTLDVVTADTENMPAVVSTAVMQELGGPLLQQEAASGAPSDGMPAGGMAAAGVPEIWLGITPGMASADLMELRTTLADVLGVDDFQVSGAAVEKAMFNQIIDILLLVVTALLGVAVLIALIGVANTLSLSVLERTRESSLLRALGLTRNQLRAMLAVEAVLIAGVAALIGIGLGALYGWLGAQSALGLFAAVTPQLPWLQLAGVLAVAVVAGLVASVMPARRAARLSPVEGLAME